MTVAIEMGTTQGGQPATLDLEELLATRLLVQGNSGSGKSHLLRRLVEQSAPWVQQALVDPEGDFVTLADQFGHQVVDAAAHTEAALQQIAARVRMHRVSVVLNLENLETERQMRHAAAFLGGLFDVDRDYWFPMLVVVDEAQLFAPAAAGEVSDEARKASLGAMTNLMCRGRKRGLAGIIATQRLAKLAKNVAAEASNFLMGRTFLDIDMSRAADLLGMERRQAEMFRDLNRGQFVALGPALSRRPLPIRIGEVETSGRAGNARLLPLPEKPPEDAHDLIFKPGENEVLRPASRPVPMDTAQLLAQLAAAKPPPPPGEVLVREVAPSPRLPEGPKTTIDEVVRQVLADPEAIYRSPAQVYQDFLVRCRQYGLHGRSLDLTAFKRKLASVRAGVDAETADTPEWDQALTVAAALSDDLQPVFLLLARAAHDKIPCPSNAQIARARGSRSPRRALGLLEHMESQGLITSDVDAYGNRTIAVPALGWQTQPGNPDAEDAEDVA
ncbi:MAG: ATP-binding protein [Magnetospirillum gryphiswaldense]|uniref:ATP-binding protein n=1 Tax=Magnetospirillum sp. 64-120 TaxID=1895778 RepID=UPI00092AD42C|nr:ATP-binding protein [Magnetospirillum sp. 64-120]MBI2242148.1 ATP-binding protein [Magnetospirillum gryphiswaldense]OJX70469.1 MAG: ATP-binding protein [Magnetospirillum sp. 64-120]